MRRLYLQIYLTLVGILVLFGVLVSVAWFLIPTGPRDRHTLDGMGVVLGMVLPAQDRPVEELRAVLERLSEALPLQVAVHSADGTLLAAVGDPLPPLGPGRRESGWLRAYGSGPTAAIRLPDGRWVMARWRHPRRVLLGWLLGLTLLAGVTAVGTYPIVRRLTRRLERLQSRVEALGAGELDARVKVEGKDEVAELARSFNRAADRIERLVSSQRNVLIGVSHELRTPLARMRMAAELLSTEDRPELLARLSRDIAELDGLIDEILLASRLDALDHLERKEVVDLLALVAEEGARVNAEVGGEPVVISGDPRALRRLVRNLLENARRYAGGTSVEASVSAVSPGGALLRVADRGPGVPEHERERVFEPFYRSAALGDRDDAGVGLGLALVRQIARHHGGEARCLPRDGGGTCFEVRLQAVTSDGTS